MAIKKTRLVCISLAWIFFAVSIVLASYARASAEARRYTAAVDLPMRRVVRSLVLRLDDKWVTLWLFRYDDNDDLLQPGAYFDVFVSPLGRIREDLSTDRDRVNRSRSKVQEGADRGQRP